MILTVHLRCVEDVGVDFVEITEIVCGVRVQRAHGHHFFFERFVVSNANFVAISQATVSVVLVNAGGE